MKLTELIEKRIDENAASYDLGTLESYKYLIEMIAIEYHNEQLRLYGVNYRRELLVEMFEKMTQPQITMLEIGDYEKLADELLSN